MTDELIGNTGGNLERWEIDWPISWKMGRGKYLILRKVND